MRNFQYTFETRKLSFNSVFSNFIAVPLGKNNNGEIQRNITNR